MYVSGRWASRVVCFGSEEDAGLDIYASGVVVSVVDKGNEAGM